MELVLLTRTAVNTWWYLLSSTGVLRKQFCNNVRQYATLGDGHIPQKLAQFIVIPNSQLNVTGDNADGRKECYFYVNFNPLSRFIYRFL